MPKYTVEQGDTLWNIAKELLGDGNRYSEIQSANNLRDDSIRPGQVLTIPGTIYGANNHGSSSRGTTNYSNTSCDNTTISADEFDAAITSNGYPSQRSKYDNFIESCGYANITEKREAAMYLATLLHESSGLRVTEENHNPVSTREYGRYIGRGYIQLSSETNYRAASIYLGEDYVKHPEKVSRDPHAWNVSAWYWQNQVHPHVRRGFRATVDYGIRPLEPHFDSRQKIYRNVCQAINVSPQL